MTLLRNGLKSFLTYLWSGWGAIASLMLFFTLWE
ncbi:MAG: ABC transporter permease, partial [Nitrosomonas sp.]|nr:ABC transporter permease [Nitrosomonas sp.]